MIRLVLAVCILLAAVFGVGLALDNRTAWRLLDDARKLALRVDRYLHRRTGRPLHGTPDVERLKERLAEHGLKLGAPVYLRIFKKESELELWLKKDGRYVRFANYPICRWSGRLGPKLKEGDRQAPEGFYTVSRGQLNPNSRWHKSFNLGFPNAFDRAHGRTGSFLMVHGGCSSIGCYAMTNPVIDEIWKLVTTSLANGQSRFHVHVFPFRMTDRNLRRHQGEWQPFWKDLKTGHDLFEKSQLPPVVSVCRGRYVFEAGTGRDARVRARCPNGAPTS